MPYTISEAPFPPPSQPPRSRGWRGWVPAHELQQLLLVQLALLLQVLPHADLARAGCRTTQSIHTPRNTYCSETNLRVHSPRFLGALKRRALDPSVRYFIGTRLWCAEGANPYKATLRTPTPTLPRRPDEGRARATSNARGTSLDWRTAVFAAGRVGPKAPPARTRTPAARSDLPPGPGGDARLRPRLWGPLVDQSDGWVSALASAPGPGRLKGRRHAHCRGVAQAGGWGGHQKNS